MGFGSIRIRFTISQIQELSFNNMVKFENILNLLCLIINRSYLYALLFLFIFLYFFFLWQIYELNLDNCRSTTIEGLTDDFTNLKSLSLINVGLTSLKGFPKLPNLQKVNNFLFVKIFMIFLLI